MDPYIGEIRLFAGNYAPTNWQFCDGSLLLIAQNQALYALLGITYGGDGQATFAVPDLRGRVPINRGSNQGNTYNLGYSGGAETVTLTQGMLPTHNHTFTVNNQVGTNTEPTFNYLASPVDNTNNKIVEFYVPDTVPTLTVQPLLPNTLTTTGGSQSHENRMPYLSISYIISLTGIYPTSS